MFLGGRQILRDQFGIIHWQFVIFDLPSEAHLDTLKPEPARQIDRFQFPVCRRFQSVTPILSPRRPRASACAPIGERRHPEARKCLLLHPDYSLPLGISASGTSACLIRLRVPGVVT